MGGTNTDIVAIDINLQHEGNRGVLAHVKTKTTPDVTAGIEARIWTVLELSRIPTTQIASITIGTTQFVNAVVEQDARRLGKVTVLRLSEFFFSRSPAVLRVVSRLDERNPRVFRVLRWRPAHRWE